MKRRELMRTAGGTAAGVAAATGGAGTAAAASAEDGDDGDGGGGTQADFEGYLDGVDGGYEDHRGEDEVTVEVGASGNGGNLAFSPAGIWVDEGTTVVWEWTGEGGAHNVVANAEAPFEPSHDVDSGEAVEEGSYEYTFEEPGRTAYVCEPHRSLNMFGAVAVGEDVPTVETGGGAATGWPEDIHHVGVPLHAHWMGVIAGLGLVLTFIFTFYVLKYGESAHTGTGRT